MSCVPYVDQMAAKAIMTWVDDQKMDHGTLVTLVVPEGKQPHC